MKQLKVLIKKIQNPQGFFTLEAIIATAGLLMITFLFIAYFVYLVPRQSISPYVHTLAQAAKIQGGITDESSEPGNSDVERFLKEMKKMGFDSERIQIKVSTTRLNENGKEVEVSLVGVEPLKEGYKEHSLYSHRNSKELIKVEVIVPSDRSMVDGMVRFFGKQNSGLKDYYFKETVMSERW